MVNLNTEYARDIVHGCRQMYNLRQKYIQNNVYIIVMNELAFSSLGNWLGKWKETWAMTTNFNTDKRTEWKQNWTMTVNWELKN